MTSRHTTRQQAAAPNDSTRSNAPELGESAAPIHISNGRPAVPAVTNDRGSEVIMRPPTDDGNCESNSLTNLDDVFRDGTILPEFSLMLVDKCFPREPDYPSPTFEPVVDSLHSPSSEGYHLADRSSLNTMTDHDMEYHVDLNQSHPESTTSTLVVPPTRAAYLTNVVGRVNRKVTRSLTRRNQTEQTGPRRCPFQRNHLERDIIGTDEQRYLNKRI